MDNMNDNTTGASPTFNSTFYMVKTDGSALHTHEVSDLQLTVTMRDGPVQDIPTSITLMDDGAVSIWFDPNKVNNHFGDTLIYGTQHLVCVESPTILQINHWAK